MNSHLIFLQEFISSARVSRFKRVLAGMTITFAAILGFASSASAFDPIAEVNAKLASPYAVVASTNPYHKVASGTQLTAAIAAALSDIANNHTPSDATQFVTAILGAQTTATARTGNATAVASGAVAGIAGLSPAPSDYAAIAAAAAAPGNFTGATTAAIATAQQNVFTTVMKASLPTLPLTTVTPNFTITNTLAAKVVQTTFTGTASSDANIDQQAAVLSAMIATIPNPTTGTNLTFTATAKTAAIANLAGAVTGAGGLTAAQAGVLDGRLARVQSANINPISAGMAANLSLQADKVTFATNAASQHTTDTGTTPLSDSVKDSMAIGIATTAATPANGIDIAVAVAGTMASGDSATLFVNLRRATVVQGVAVAEMKASLPASVATTAPDFSSTSATYAIIAKVVTVSQFSTTDASANLDGQVQVLNAIFAALPASSAVVGSQFTATNKLNAEISIASAITSVGAGVSAAVSGTIAGRLARTQSVIMDQISDGIASNLTALSDKTTFATAAAAQLTSAAGNPPLSDIVKNSIAVGVSRTAASGSNEGDIVAAVASTMKSTDPGTTASNTVDIRYATLATKVFALNYTLAPAITQEMLAQLPISNPSALWSTSSTVTIAAKFATTLTGAIPAVSTVTGVTLASRTAALTGATVSINDQYNNDSTGLPIKVAVAQAVIGVNATLATNIAQAVANEAFTSASGWTSSGYAGSLAVQKATFVKALATGLSDINKGLVAAGGALADYTLAGQIALQVGNLPTGTTSPGAVTPASRAAIAVAIAKPLNTNANITSILSDIAATGGSAYTSTDPIDQATYASTIINSLTAATAGFVGQDVVTPISHAIANYISTDGTDVNAAADSLTFVGKLTNLQKTNATRIGTIFTAVAPVFSTQIPLLATTMTTNATTAVVNIASAAAAYSPSDAVAIATQVSAVTGVVATAAPGIFNATATYAASTQTALSDKATQVGLVAQGILASFQAQAPALATSAAALSTSILNDAGRATVAGMMASSLTGSATVISTNAVAIADNLAKSVTSVTSKGDIAAAVIYAQTSTLKAVVQKVVVESGVGTDTLKAQVGAQIATQLPTQMGPVAAAVASTTGVLAADAPLIADTIATGRTLAQQVAISFAVAGVQTAQASNVATTVLTRSLNDLGTISDYQAKATAYAGVAAQYTTQFYSSSTATVQAAAPTVAGFAATQAATGVTPQNLFYVAKIFGGALQTAINGYTLQNATAPKIATSIGTILEPSVNHQVIQLSEVFADVAVALTHFIPTTDITDMENVAKNLATIEPKAAPDILGQILTDLAARGVSLTSTSPTVTGLKAAVTVTGVTTSLLTTVITDVLGHIGQQYVPFLNLTGQESVVHNG